MLITMVITGLGSLYTVFVGDYTSFILARTVTGIGVGADLALVNTYINEVAPNQGRVKYTSLIFIMSSIGTSLGICLGLYLTTPAAPFPFGLPFALATPHFVVGWRIMYGIGASLAVVGLLLRLFALPESPRWLISRGHLSAAERIVSRMEKQALARLSELPPVAPALPIRTMAHSTLLGSLVLTLGAYLWLPMTYTWSTENYPTRARASGFALVDGIGHIRRRHRGDLRGLARLRIRAVRYVCAGRELSPGCRLAGAVWTCDPAQTFG